MKSATESSAKRQMSQRTARLLNILFYGLMLAWLIGVLPWLLWPELFPRWLRIIRPLPLIAALFVAWIRRRYVVQKDSANE